MGAQSGGRVGMVQQVTVEHNWACGSRPSMRGKGAGGRVVWGDAVWGVRVRWFPCQTAVGGGCEGGVEVGMGWEVEVWDGGGIRRGKGGGKGKVGGGGGWEGVCGGGGGGEQWCPWPCPCRVQGWKACSQACPPGATGWRVLLHRAHTASAPWQRLVAKHRCTIPTCTHPNGPYNPRKA